MPIGRVTAVFLAVISLTAFAGTGLTFKQADSSVKKWKFPVDETMFPIVDYTKPEPADSVERAKRKAKGEKYNRPESAIDPQLITVSDIYHWDANMPSLPVAQSDVILIGEIIGTEAHLSSDKTGVYSEFTVEIIKLLKNDASKPLKFPGRVAVERTGGRIRFPSGHITLMYVGKLGLPRVGCKYVLFLTHDFPFQIRRDEDYRILTGYGLIEGRVVPLDSSGVVKFALQEGKEEHEFLMELQNAINRAREISSDTERSLRQMPMAKGTGPMTSF